MKYRLCITVLFLYSAAVAEHTVFAQPDIAAVSVPHIDTPYTASDAVNSLTEHFYIGTTYTNNFFLPQVGLAELKMVYPSKYINTSVNTSFYGYSEYFQVKTALGFSHFFKPYIAIGLEAFFCGVRFNSDTGFKATGGVSLSILAFPTNKLAIGFLAENISFSPIKADGTKHRLPTIFSLGLSYSFTPNIMLAIEGSKELTNPFLIRLDFEYRPVRQFILRCGTSYQTTASANIGFGLRFGKFLFDTNIKYNVRVSWGCQVGLGIQLCDSKNEKHTH